MLPTCQVSVNARQQLARDDEPRLLVILLNVLDELLQHTSEHQEAAGVQISTQSSAHQYIAVGENVAGFDFM